MGTRSHARASAAASQRCTRVHGGASPKTYVPLLGGTRDPRAAVAGATEDVSPMRLRRPAPLVDSTLERRDSDKETTPRRARTTGRNRRFLPN